jgi:hypothetical protein
MAKKRQTNFERYMAKLRRDPALRARLEAASRSWDVLFASLGKFSDDFMDNRNQPLSEGNEDFCDR